MRNLLDVPGIPEPYNAPRQSLPSAWFHFGAIDAVRAEVIRSGSMTGNNVLPFLMDEAYAFDIDAVADLRRAEPVVATVNSVRPGSLEWGRVRLLAVDVDGTLTPGTVYYSLEGEALKSFHMHDGQGLAAVQALGVEVAMVTRETTDFVRARASKLGIAEVHTGADDKVAVLRSICASRGGLTMAGVAYVGDDLSDLAAIDAVNEAGGITCAVSDARPEVLARARFVCSKPGGAGAVRDVCDRIVQAKRAAT
jgi:YrbI family 3-deoxy-D-manno-octulosonate 8-phosphate phosphatase